MIQVSGSDEEEEKGCPFHGRGQEEFIQHYHIKVSGGWGTIYKHTTDDG
jgi:hypothetical protein